LEKIKDILKESFDNAHKIPKCINIALIVTDILNLSLPYYKKEKFS